MKTNINKTLIIAIITAVLAIPASFAFAESQEPSLSGTNTGGVSVASDATVPAPVLSGTNTGGVSVASNSTPTLSGTNTGGVSVSANSVPTLSGTNTGGVSVAATVPPAGNTGGGSGSSNTSNTSNTSAVVNTSTSRSGGHSSLYNTNTIAGNCSYIVTYLKMGTKNDYSDVVRLQSFLRNTEGQNVDINGIFDTKTIDAVKAFQSKYASDILTPWNIKAPTGNVYFTTTNKINELVCKKTIALTADQKSQIESYKKGEDSGSATLTKTDAKTEVKSTETKSNTELVSKDKTQTATIANTSFLGKTWKFVKWLFGY